jgi:hypothetical protein
VLLCHSLLLKIGPRMRLTSTIEPRRPGRKTVPCEYHSNPVAFGTGELVIRSPWIARFPTVNCLWEALLWNGDSFVGFRTIRTVCFFLDTTTLSL